MWLWILLIALLAAALLIVAWFFAWRRWEGLAAWRGVRYLVVHNNTLYVHSQEEGQSTPLTRGLLAVYDGAQYVDSVYEWSGEVLANRTRIIGERTDRPGWYESFDRTVVPEPGQLIGDEWSSISIDWNHHDSSGASVPEYGAAQLEQDGDVLRVTDTHGDDSTYYIEATWRGDHYEGEWWSAEFPDYTSFWRGEFLGNDAYLHGSWANGEWSFTPLPIVTESELPADADAVFVLNPYFDRALVARDDDRGLTVTGYRQQGPITDLTFTLPGGPIEVRIDDRARPTSISGLGETVTAVWADDSSSARVTIHNETSGETTVTTIPIDVSDSAILDIVDRWESEDGLDMAAYRQWILDNPGSAQAVASGARSLFDATAGGDLRTLTDQRNPIWIEDVNKMLEVYVVMVAMFGAMAVGLVALGVVSLAVIPLAVAAAAMAVVVIIGILVFAIWEAIESDTCCYPCGLACFVSCCAPWERPD